MVEKKEKVDSGRCLGVFRSHEGTVYSLDVFWKGGRPPMKRERIRRSKTMRVEPGTDEDGLIALVTGSHDQTILVWDVAPSTVNKKDLAVKVTQAKKLRGHTADVYAMEIVPEFSEYVPHSQNQIAQSKYDKRVVNLVSGGDYTVRTWNIGESNTCLQTLQGHLGYVACLKVKGKRAFSGSWDTTVRSWNLETGKAMHVFKGHKNIINCIDVTDTDIFSGSWDMSIIQWSRATGEPVNVFQGHTDGVQCLQVHDENIITGSMDKTVRVWSIATTKTVKVLRGHQGGVECLSAVNKLCFTGSYDKTIRCFNLETGECLMVFEGHTDGVYCLKFFEGILYSGSGDRSIRLWDARDLVEQASKPWWKRLLRCFGIK
ncbi:WD40-repeat-containing domain protein [Polychytrium aggregatum]|uniref:WD40-repeat-containing domain protein n=1 Tax=Polychytrium aggregatum TaxID=110093 RepID=UPI0022FE07A5|nr:WD40-repeat-containing domain protein [Polychytrium aggregatum]KAI9199473.1 WD40-repeat-containing domain protein [Polychytrium aggregatum]